MTRGKKTKSLALGVDDDDNDGDDDDGDQWTRLYFQASRTHGAKRQSENKYLCADKVDTVETTLLKRSANVATASPLEDITRVTASQSRSVTRSPWRLDGISNLLSSNNRLTEKCAPLTNNDASHLTTYLERLTSG